MNIKKKVVILIIGLMIGIIVPILSVCAASYIISSDKVKYIDNSGLGTDNVQGAIDKVCANIDTRLDGLKTYTYNYVETTTYQDGALRITHNLNLSNYTPIVTLAPQQSHAYVIYNIVNITPNYFDVYVASIDAYVLAQPATGSPIKLLWTY